MDVLFDCNKCGKRLSIPSEQASSAVRCPHCGAVIEAPASHPAPPSPPPPPPAPQAPWAQPPAAPAAGSGRDQAARYRLLGILTLVAAGLNFLMAFFMLMRTVQCGTGALDAELSAQGPYANKELVMAMLVAMTVLSFITAAVAPAAGLKMLRGGPGARGWALGSGIMMCCSLWTCCLWPLNLALGIYSLVVFFQDRPA
jgi:hypothetical protein